MLQISIRYITTHTELTYNWTAPFLFTSCCWSSTVLCFRSRQLPILIILASTKAILLIPPSPVYLKKHHRESVKLNMLNCRHYSMLYKYNKNYTVAAISSTKMKFHSLCTQAKLPLFQMSWRLWQLSWRVSSFCPVSLHCTSHWSKTELLRWTVIKNKWSTELQVGQKDTFTQYFSWTHWAKIGTILPA